MVNMDRTAKFSDAQIAAIKAANLALTATAKGGAVRAVANSQTD